MLIKTSYEIGFGTITSALLIISYSLLKGQDIMIFFCAVPFVLSVGGIIYLHIIKELLVYFSHIMIIEKNVNKNLPKNKKLSKGKKEIELLDMVSNFGFYGPNFINNMSSSGKIMTVMFSFGYFISCILGLSALYIYKIAYLPDISKINFSQINLFHIIDTITKKISAFDFYASVMIILIISYITIVIIFIYLCGSIVEIYTNNFKILGIKRKTSLSYKIALYVYKKMKISTKKNVL